MHTVVRVEVTGQLCRDDPLLPIFLGGVGSRSRSQVAKLLWKISLSAEHLAEDIGHIS